MVIDLMMTLRTRQNLLVCCATLMFASQFQKFKQYLTVNVNELKQLTCFMILYVALSNQFSLRKDFRLYTKCSPIIRSCLEFSLSSQTGSPIADRFESSPDA